MALPIVPPSDMGDVLTDVLRATRLKPRMVYRRGFYLSWGAAFAAPAGASFHYVEQGACWLRSPKLPEPLLIQQGELIVLPNSTRHELSDMCDSPVVPIAALMQQAGRTIANPEPSAPGLTTLVCGEFTFEQHGVHPLFSLLPPLIHVHNSSAHGGQTVEWLLILVNTIGIEVNHIRPGRETIISRLTEVLFIMIMRYWIENQGNAQGSWLSALHDPRIAAALGALHRQPERAWTVEQLAAEVNWSRSAFAARFSQLVGEAPLKYLTRWRMQLAMMWLADTEDSIEAIAWRTGYTSVYAFSKTFKRLTGVAPGAYRKARRLGKEM